MPLNRNVCAGIVLAAMLCTAGVTGSVAPLLSFDDLVTRADTVFRGEVVGVQPGWVEYHGSRGISTLVVFKVDRMLKGEPALQIVLDFLGGTIGDTTYEILGVPRLQLGDRGVFFVRRQGLFVSPIVGLSQGRFPIQHDAERDVDVVKTHDDWAFATVRDIGAIPRVGPQVRTMRLDDFERTIQLRVAQTGR